MAHPMGLYRATFLDIGFDPFHDAAKLSVKALLGSDYNKLQIYTEDAEIQKGRLENADVDLFYWRLLSQFWAIKGGVNYYDRPAHTPYWQPGVGIEGLMPYFIDTNIRSYYHDGSAKLDIQLSRDTQITNNFFVRAGIRSLLASKTVEHDMVGSGLQQMRYLLRPYFWLRPGLAIFAEYEHTQAYGVTRRIWENAGDAAQEDTWTFGVSVLF